MTVNSGLREIYDELKREFPKHEEQILDLVNGFEAKINAKMMKWKK